MENGVLVQGLLLVGVGMGIVVTFLYLLVQVMRSFAFIMPRFKHLLPELDAKPSQQKTVRSEDATIAVVIAAAVARSLGYMSEDE